MEKSSIHTVKLDLQLPDGISVEKYAFRPDVISITSVSEVSIEDAEEKLQAAVLLFAQTIKGLS